MAYDNTNTGVLFVKKERKSEKQPNFEGRINIDGRDYDLVAWTKVSTKTGEKFLSLKIEEPKQGTKTVKKAEPLAVSDIPDELPF